MRILPSLLLLILWTSPSLAQDPTRPPSPAEIRAWLNQTTVSTAEAEAEDWHLQSILTSDQRRLAIVNGQRLRPGDRIDAAEVLAIEADRVVLGRNGRQIVLLLGHRHQTPMPQD